MRKRSALRSKLRTGSTYRAGKAARSRAYVRPAQRGFLRAGGYYGRYSAKTGETKFHDFVLDDALIATAGTVTPSINLIAEGTTESTRIGRKCRIVGIGWKWTCALNSQDAQATPASGDVARIIMFIDKQANGATAAVTDILETANYQSFNNLSNSSRFRTLMDKTVVLNRANMASDGAGVVSNSNNFRAGTFYKKCNIPLEWSGTTGVITELRSNNVGVLLISKAGGMVFDSQVRVRFSDN